MDFYVDLSKEKLPKESSTLFFNKKDIEKIDDNLIVSYKNSFYNFIFPNFNSIDFDFFISICCLLKEKGSVLVDIDYKFLLKLINSKKRYSKKEFFTEFKNFTDKSINIHFINKSIDNNNNRNYTYCSVFSKIELNEKEGRLIFLLNDVFFDILNNFKNGFYSSFLLKTFLSLKSKYSKMLYILLAQFIYKGSFYIDLKDFYFYLSLKDLNTYKNLGVLEQKILSPIIDELQTIPNLVNLSYQKIKKDKTNPKSKVIALHFTF